MPDYTLAEVNAWTLRCIFNQSRLEERITAGEFTIVSKRKASISKNPQYPPNTKSQMIWIQDQNGTEVATAHYFVCPAGPVTPLDPKTIKIGSIRYIIAPERLRAYPEEHLPYIWMRKVYGWVRRKIICPVFGPLDVVPG
jgi:hypothetical protein